LHGVASDQICYSVVFVTEISKKQPATEGSKAKAARKTLWVGREVTEHCTADDVHRRDL